MTEKKHEMRYLGDGVYASFDGYQVWLHIGSHDSENVCAINPVVLKNLNQYWDDVHKVPGS